MPSKLTNILAIGGLSVVTAVEGSSLHQLVTEHEVGIVVNPDDVLSLTIAIKDAVEHDYNNIRGNAISYAEQHFSITNIISKYSLQMEDIQNENLVESMEFHLKTSFSSMEAKV
jgi:colanic acid biosynthesis glycosyl transferase WcaI